MTDQDRFEHIEEVRNLYREQGAEVERKRIIELLEKWGEDNDRCYCCNNDVAAFDLTELIEGGYND